MITDEDILEELKEAGGATHGPIVETVTMPLAHYINMRRAKESQVDAIAKLYHGALEGYGGGEAHMPHVACVQMWEALGVADQTAAMQKLRTIKEASEANDAWMRRMRKWANTLQSADRTTLHKLLDLKDAPK